MKLNALAPFALVAAAIASPGVATAQETHTGRINAIAEHYHTLKTIANSEEYWLIMSNARQLNNPNVTGSIARANLMMNTIAEGTYDNNIRAQAELTVCAGKDIGWVMYVLRGDNALLRDLGRTAANASYSVENVTRDGNIAIQRDCPTVLNRRVPQ